MSPWIINMNLTLIQKALKVSVCIYIYIYIYIYILQLMFCKQAWHPYLIPQKLQKQQLLTK